ncbi:hypothetical protein H5410_005576 [Solanum commersonii]|uniref:Uncharacterized protein n=1 Tax=Solanum commersonii TaxID=4109 RepID=A0A9J6A6S9_SOLCO|nr:hypothetical protein H5410_005576 [Solanum commersonii]
MEVEYDLIVQEQGYSQCNNYRGIKLLSHNMKVWERMRRGVSTTENQFGFMSKCSTTKPYISSRKEIDVKTHTTKSLGVLWRCSKARGVLVSYIKGIKDMYDGAKTRVRMLEETRSTSKS